MRPIGETVKAFGESMVFTCELKLSDAEKENEGDKVDYTIQWFHVEENNREITDKTGRLIIFFSFSDIITAVLGFTSCR